MRGRRLQATAPRQLLRFFAMQVGLIQTRPPTARRDEHSLFRGRSLLVSRRLREPCFGILELVTFEERRPLLVHVPAEGAAEKTRVRAHPVEIGVHRFDERAERGIERIFSARKDPLPAGDRVRQSGVLHLHQHERDDLLVVSLGNR